MSLYLYYMKKGNNKKWTEAQLRESVKTSRSLAEVLRKLNLYTRGANYTTMKRYIVHLNLDISHFDGKPWTTGLRLVNTESLRSLERIRERLLQDRGHQCEECKYTTWRGVKIPLELHHIDGNNTNNADNNLQLVCPNCHSLTPSWRRQKSVIS